jgi:hypothetical protein
MNEISCPASELGHVRSAWQQGATKIPSINYLLGGELHWRPGLPAALLLYKHFDGIHFVAGLDIPTGYNFSSGLRSS